ncbi:MAG: ABC transporter permease [Candidatus Woesearchaeota archaeon]|nr:ABC transporter permease [Candidatus Woesearchaeota archaeon]
MKLHRINALLLKYYYISINRVDRIFDIFYWPIIDLFVWGFTSAFIENISEYNVLSMLLGGIMLWMFVWRGSQDIAVYVLEDFWSRSLYHVFSSPLTIHEHMSSIMLLALLRGIASFVFLALAAFLLYQFNILSISPLFLAISVFILTLLGWIMGLFVTSLVFIFGKRIQVLAWSVVWIVQPFSCVFYPLSAVPAWAQPIAKALPTTHVFENLRALLNGSAVQYGQLLYAFGVELVLLFVVMYLLKWSFLRAKKTGLLARAY